MRELLVIAVGRLKTPHWQAAAEHYWKRLNFTMRAQDKIIKDADPDLPLDVRIQTEGQRILQAIPAGRPVFCLDERGKSHSSRGFATLLSALYDEGKSPCFIIGGAFGLSDDVRKRATHLLAFGPMTFPHELARVLLYEQLYRAESIMAGTGYHH